MKSLTRTIAVLAKNCHLDIGFDLSVEGEKLIVTIHCEDNDVEIYLSPSFLEESEWDVLDYKIENELLGLVQAWTKEHPKEPI